MSRKTKIVVAAGVLVVAFGAAAAISQTGGPGGRFGLGPHGGFGHGWGHFGGDGDWGGGFRGRFGSQLTRDEFDARTRERFARLDRNNDGVVDAAEVEASLTERMADGPMGRMGRMGQRQDERMLRFFDADRDGKVTRDEFLAGVRARFAEMDLDGDGRISDADLPPAMRGRNALSGGDAGGFGGPGSGRRGHGPLAMLRDADADRDGVVTLDEVLAAAGRRFALWDRNADGVVDPVDREALRKETVDYRVKRFFHQHGARDGRVTREQFATKAAERFAHMDFDRDGVISRAERPGWWGGHHGRGGHEGRGRWWRDGEDGRGGSGGSGAPDGERGRGGPGGSGGPGPGGPGSPGNPRGI